MAQRIEIIITAKDDASKAFGSISGNMQKLGKVALGVAAGGIAALGVGVFAVASKAIPAASNLNEALNASSVVFGEAAGKIQEFGETAADVAGLSATEFNQMAAQTGSMLQNYGLAADEAADATIDLATRAADMASIFNTDVSDAMTAINAAMRGEADPIERFGVSMNAAAVDAKALALGFEKVDGQFSNTAKTQARLALLMEQTDKIAGDFVNTSDQLANASRINEKRWENFMAQVGQVGLPIMKTMQTILMNVGEKVFPIITAALDSAMPVVEAVASAIANFVDGLISGEDIIGDVSNLVYELALAFGLSEEQAAEMFLGVQNLIAGVQNFIATAQEVLKPVTSWISQNVELKDVLIGLGVAVLSVVIPAVISLIASILPIILTFAAVVAAVALLRNAWESNFLGIRDKTQAVIEFLEKFIGDFLETIQTWWAEHGEQVIATIQALWATVSGATTAFVNWMSTTISNFIQAIQGFWAAHGEAITAKAQEIWDAVKAIFEFFRDQFMGIYDAFRLAFEGDWEGFGEKLREVWDRGWQAIKDIAGRAWDFIKDGIRTLVSNITSEIEDTDWGAVGSSIVQGIAAGISAGAHWAINAIISVAKSIMDSLKGFFKASSPSKLLQDFAEFDLMGAMGSGMLSGARFPVLAMQSVSAQTLAAGSSVVNNYTLNINEAGRIVDPAGSMMMLKALAGV